MEKENVTIFLETYNDLKQKEKDLKKQESENHELTKKIARFNDVLDKLSDAYLNHNVTSDSPRRKIEELAGQLGFELDRNFRFTIKY